MEQYRLEHFTKGWYLGNFLPTLLNTKNFEIAIKRYKAHDYEKRHFHKKSTEYTVIISGSVMMNEKLYKENDIIVIKPKQDTDFLCLEDVVTVVVKVPSSRNDKYEGKYK